MKIIELEELKQIELQIMAYVDRVCSKNEIRYWCVGGTLLGAVRHDGFIPWDDDIDIAMPRKDFEKFCSVIQNISSDYSVIFYDNAKDYGYPFPKVIDNRTLLIDYKLGMGKEIISVYVDVFLYDGMGNSKGSAYLRYYILKCLKKMVFLSKRNFKMENLIKTIVFFIPCLLCKAIGVTRLNRFYNLVCSKKDFYNTKYVACVAGRYGKREIFEKSVFEKTVPLVFEKLTLQAPAKYDEYLSSIYNDYMELPPKEKRISNHTEYAFWKNDELY